jgi:hypothetical protein
MADVTLARGISLSGFEDVNEDQTASEVGRPVLRQESAGGATADV